MSLSYLFADVKHSKNGMKICEFGEMQNSLCNGHDFLVGYNYIWTETWKRLLAMGPVYIVGPIPSYRARYLMIDYAVKLGCTRVRKPLNQCVFPRGAVVFANKISTTTRLAYQRKHPFVRIINARTGHVANNKARLHTVAQGSQYRPKSLLLRRGDTQNREKILRHIPSNWIVIKPVGSYHGRGILVDTRANINKMLNTVHRGSGEGAGIYWRRNRTPTFLVEEYIRSLPVSYESEPYDAATRLVFFLHGRKLTPIASYYKLPPQSLNSKLPIRRRVVNNIKPLISDKERKMPHWQKVPKHIEDDLFRQMQDFWNGPMALLQ